MYIFVTSSEDKECIIIRKRLRKKLHHGEFQEFGFLMEWQFHAPQSEQQLDAFMDALIDVIEERSLTFGGGTNPASGSGFVCLAKNGSPQEADRAHLQNWLLSRPETTSIHVGELEDAWNPDTRQYQHLVDMLESESPQDMPTIVSLPPESGI